MSWPLVWRRNRDADVAAATAETGQQRERAVKAEEERDTELAARREITGLYCALSDEHDQTVARNQSLCALLDELKDAAGIEANARRQADRIARLQKAVKKARAEAAGEARRASTLQACLDDALGLNSAAVVAGEGWQARREQRMRFDKPSAEEATAS